MQFLYYLLIGSYFFIMTLGCVLPPRAAFNTAKPLGASNVSVSISKRGYYTASGGGDTKVFFSKGIKGLGLGYGATSHLGVYLFLEQQEQLIPTVAVKYSVYRNTNFFSAITVAYSTRKRYFDDEKSKYKLIQIGSLNTYQWGRWALTAQLSINKAVWKTLYTPQDNIQLVRQPRLRIIIPGQGSIIYEQLDLFLQYNIFKQLSVGPFANFLLHHKSYGSLEIEFIEHKIFSSFFGGISLAFRF